MESSNDSKLYSTVYLGGYSWSRIGELEDKPLYLCDKIIDDIEFSTSGKNDYSKSDVRKWLNNLYNLMSDKDKLKVFNNPKLGDGLFLLSIDEYNKFKDNIEHIDEEWWLRSPSDNSCSSNGSVYGYVNYDGIAGDGYFTADYINGIRPAFLMSIENVKKLKILSSQIEDTYVHYKSLCDSFIEAGGDADYIDQIVHSIDRLF